jgi:hypothetical protein
LVSLLVIPIKREKYRYKKEGMKKMIKDEEYICFLKRVIACVSNGDYYSVKELSQLELEKMEKKQKTNKRRILIKD